MNENKKMDPLVDAYPFINGVLYNLSERRLDAEHYRQLEEIQELKEMRVNAQCDKILRERTIENIEVYLY